MAVRVAINGFGRIGRQHPALCRRVRPHRYCGRGINDLGPVETNAHLLRYDSVHGRFPHKVTVDGDTIDAGRGPIKVTAIKNPPSCPIKS